MQTLSIGRAATNNIVLNDTYVSRQHAQLIIMDDGQVKLKDLGSNNGTFVNGNKISEAYLKPGDIVKCGNAFLSWGQYVSGNISLPAPQSYQQETPLQNFNQQNTAAPSQQFSLGETLKYLTIKILNVGDLFKTEWNRTPATVFFLLAPVALSIIMSSVHMIGFNYLSVLIPSFLSFGVSQFLTLSLFSINRDTKFDKTIYASSIYSFMQFLYVFIIILGINFYYNVTLSSYDNWYSSGISKFWSDSSNGYHSNNIISLLLPAAILIAALASVTISTAIYIFKYFRAIGVSKSVSIHFTIMTYCLNALLQFILVYLFYRIQ